MHRQVSTNLSISLIAIFALIVAVYSIAKTYSLNSAVADQDSSLVRVEKKSTACKNHAFAGPSTISVWHSEEKDRNIINVKKDNTGRLPVDNIEKIKLVDATPEIEGKLMSSSEEKPIELDISGFAILCDGTALASLSYKDGIFRPFMTN